MKIAQVSDLHLNDGLSQHFKVAAEKNLDIIFEDIINQSIDCIVFTGDFGSRKGLKYLKSKIDEYPVKTFFTLGNHDQGEDLIEAGLVKNKEEFQRKLGINDISVILLDSSKGILSAEQKIWLKNNMETEKPNIVFTHYPLISTTKPCFDRALGLKNQNEMTALFREIKHSKVIIFAGHYHGCDEIESDGIKQIICPAGIMQTTEKDNELITESFEFGYNLIEINNPSRIKNDRIEYKPIMFQGKGIDNPWGNTVWTDSKSTYLTAGACCSLKEEQEKV